MKQRTTLHRLSAAVLAGGLLLGTAGTALASPSSDAGTGSTAGTQKGTSSTSAKADKHRKNSNAVVRALTEGTNADLASALENSLGKTETTKSLVGLLKEAPANALEKLRQGPAAETALPSRLVLEALKQSVSGAAGTCDTNTALQKWASKLLPLAPEETEEGDTQRSALAGLLILGVLDAPTYHALFIGDSRKAFTVMGEEQDKTKVVKNAFKSAKNFFDVEPGTITVSALKDDIVSINTKKVRTELAHFALFASPYTGVVIQADGNHPYDPRKPYEHAAKVPHIKKFEAELARLLPQLFELTPFLDDGESPIFTANAFAYAPTTALEKQFDLPKRFVFGDGMLTFLREAKFGDTGIKTVVGHEYGHHVQFALGGEAPGATVPERTRHSELEADSFANYFVAHKQGLKFTKAQRQLSIDLGYAIGDCETKGDGHHGTPAQRKAAAVWGQELADTQKAKGHIFAAESIRLKFNRAVPTLLTAK